MRMLGAFPVLLLFLCLAGGCSLLPRSPAYDAEQVADLDGVKVAYRDLGVGDTTIVFVHGWASDRSVWDEQLEGLREHARLLLVDLPGHGKSDKPEDHAYTMESHARAVAAVMDDADVERAVLVGHSNGTPVIRQFYRLYPQRTAGLVVVDGTLKSFGPASMRDFAESFRGDDYAQKMQETAELFVSRMKESHKDKVRTMLATTPQFVAVRELEGAADPAIWTEDRIEVPVLAVMAQSPIWTAEYEAYVRGLVPGIDYRVVPGVTHFLMIDDPNTFNSAVLQFLRAASDVARVAEYDGVEVFYRDAGSGAATLVLVHGWACDHEVWSRQLAGLRDDARLLAIDLPGQGRSGKPKDFSYSMDDLAGAVAAVMDDAGVQRAVLVGHSNGGLVCRQFYRRFPERTAALVIVDEALVLPPVYRDQMKVFAEAFRGEDFAEHMEAMVGQIVGRMEPRDQERIRRMVHETPQFVALATFDAGMDPAIWEPDPIGVPVLSVMADNPISTGGYENDLRRLAPDLDYRVLPDVGHFLMMDEPEAFDAAVVEFLAAKGLR